MSVHILGKAGHSTAEKCVLPACRLSSNLTKQAFWAALTMAEVCLVVVPFSNPQPMKLGLGVTSITEAVALGLPVITADYKHYANYCFHGRNSLLVKPVGLFSGSQYVQSQYTNAIMFMLANIDHFQGNALDLAQQFTIETYTESLMSAFRDERGKRSPEF